MSSQHHHHAQYDKSFDNNPKLRQINYAPSSISEAQYTYNQDRYNAPIPRLSFQDDNNVSEVNLAQGHADSHMPIDTCDPSNLSSFHQIQADPQESQGSSASWASTPMVHTPLSNQTRSSSPFPEFGHYPALSEENPANTLSKCDDVFQPMASEQDQTARWQTWTTYASPAPGSFSSMPGGTHLPPYMLPSQSLQVPSPTAGHSVPSPHPVPNRYRKPPKMTSDLWTEEMDSLILMLKGRKIPHQEISAELLDKFGIDRNPNVVAKRIRKLQKDAVDPEKLERCMTEIMPQVLSAFAAGIYSEFGRQYVMHKDEELKLKRTLETLYQTSVLQQRQFTYSGSTMGPWQAENA